MTFVLGVDGGGSKTYTVITDSSGNKLGSGRSGRSNYQNYGIENALYNIKKSIDHALSEAGLSYDDIEFAQYGLSGADREKDFNILRPALATLPFKRWDVVCDTYEGLRIGSKNNVGVVLVCGSGTNAAGRNHAGMTVQTGGFGYFYGDGAGVGGRSLAKETFRAAMRSWEFRDIPSILTQKVPQYFGFSSMEALYHDFLDRNVYEVDMQLSIVLHEAADEDDELAVQLLRQAGAELGLAANSVIRRLGGFGDDMIPIILVGSILQKGKNAHLLQSLRSTIEEKNPLIELILPNMEPVFGSVLLALDQLQIECTEAMVRKFEQEEG